MLNKILNNRTIILYLLPFTLGLMTVFSFQPFNLSFINFFILPIFFLLIVYVRKKSKSVYRKKPYRKNLFLIGLLPLTIGLIIKAKHGINIAVPILFLITGSLFAGAVVEMLSDHFVTLPYRFVPTIVFFAVGVGILFSHRLGEK